MGTMNLIAYARARGWGLLLPLLALQYALLTTQPAVIAVELAGALLLTVFRPRAAAQAVPFGLVILGLWGIDLVRDLERGGLPPGFHGVVPLGGGLWPGRLVLPEAVLFMAAGVWLFLRTDAPGSALLRALARRLAQAVAGARPAGPWSCCRCWPWLLRCSASATGSASSGGPWSGRW